ncbi:MAG: hypothetical protein JZU52_20830, partial [Lamprocystis purpurea]|nr:hypothetical protein [Lamprocystis purpurea]
GWIRRAVRCQGPGTSVARAASTRGRAVPPKFGIAVTDGLALIIVPAKATIRICPQMSQMFTDEENLCEHL